MSRRLRQRVRQRIRKQQGDAPSAAPPEETRLLAGDAEGRCPFDEKVLTLIAAARYGATLAEIAWATGVKPTRRLKLTEIGLRTASRLMAQGKVKATANNRFVAA